MYKVVLAALVAVALAVPALGNPAPDGSVAWPVKHYQPRLSFIPDCPDYPRCTRDPCSGLTLCIEFYCTSRSGVRQ
jgi:hypothetical protein